MSEQPRRRVARSASVVRTEQVSRDLVRVWLTGPDLEQIPELQFTDHYIKLLFAPPGADYAWPFDPDEVRETLPREQWPVTRTYTIRSFDRESSLMAVDFVVHGDEGLAGPWAANAQPGDQLGFNGPGGAWAPDPAADVHLFVGDESAVPAIAAALERMPDGARAEVFVEVADEAARMPMPTGSAVNLHWVHREGTGLSYGEPLVRAVRDAGLPSGDLRAFVHGNAGMIKDLRRWLFIENGVAREHVSISGYWRTGHDENGWQSGKREFMAQVEREEADLVRDGSV